MKAIWISLAFACVAMGQTPVVEVNPCLKQACYYATTSVSVAAGASTTLTVQQPATGGTQVSYLATIVQCPGQSFTVDQSQNGTAATTTAGTAVPLIPTTSTATAKVFTASNVGSGTAVAPTLTYSSGSIATIDLTQRTTGLSGTANNYSVKVTNTGAVACTATASTYWMEKQ